MTQKQSKIIIIILLFGEFFFISVSWWFLTRVWVTTSLLKSPGLFLVFWLILMTLLFGGFPLVFLFLSPPIACTNSLVTVSSAPITIGIIVTFTFNRFWVLVQGLGIYLSSLSFSFTLWSARSAKSTIRQVLFFCCITRSGRLAEIRWSICI